LKVGCKSKGGAPLLIRKEILGFIAFWIKHHS
jgi:hypothetical protein